MRMLAKFTLLLALAAVAATAPASAPGAVSCHKINAKGVGQDLGGGNTTATIIGGGLLHGTTAASFAILGFVPPSTALIAGTITFTVNKGTLTATLDGTFDIVTGAFTATTTGMSGTGKLAGVTGQLTLTGVEDFSTGAFTEDVTGQICVDLAP